MASKPHEESLKDKVKQFLGLKKGGGTANIRSAAVREIVFTAELLKEIGPESPANHRIKTIRELCEVVQLKLLELHAVEALWIQVADLLQPHVAPENRHLALKFLTCLVRGQYDQLDIMRAHFFRVIRSHTLFEDLNERLDFFLALSDNGKDLTHFEEDTGEFLLQWMSEVISSSRTNDYMHLLTNVIKFNAAYLDQEVVSGIVQNTCIVCNRSSSEEDIELCLQVLDTVICYSFLPSDSLFHFIESLCRTVNVERFCQTSWKLMRNLLGSHYGHSGVYTMCCILQDNRNIRDVSLLRGAVFFIGMALWGSKRIQSIKHTPASVLPSFLQALQCQHPVVVYEVVLSLQRLVKKYGKDIQLVTWDIILDICEKLLTLSEHVIANESAISTILHDILSAVEHLYETGSYHGSTSRFFDIIEKCAKTRPASSVLVLISYRAQSIHPAMEDWIQNMYHLMESYFRYEIRTAIRKKVLDILSCVLSANKQLYEDDLIESIVLPQLTHIEQDSDPEIRDAAVQLLVDLAQACTTPRCMDLLALLEKVLQKSFLQSTPSSPTSKDSDIICFKEDIHITDVKTAAIGLVEIFKTKMYKQPTSHTIKTYELLINHVRSHYEQQVPSRVAASIRFEIFKCLLHLRADSLHRIGLPDFTNDNQLKFSSYLQCYESEDHLDVYPTSCHVSPAGSVAPSPTPLVGKMTVLPYSLAFQLISVTCLEQEKDWTVLRMVLSELPLVLQNKTLIFAAKMHVESLCKRLCAMVSDRNLGFPGILVECPPNFTKSDFHSHIFPVLTCLASYNAVLDKGRQRDLINCLEFGLVSKCAKDCVSALTVCTMEMQEVMMRLLPDVLSRLAQISATVAMAAPMLEFLSTLINFPKLYTNFNEKQYMSIFAIALPYTNPFKFSHYTVSLSYRVIYKWFLKCRMSFRKDLVGFINRGLQANVLRQIDESTKFRHSLPAPSTANEDSTGRPRISSLGKRPSKPDPQPPAQDHKPQMDEAMSVFHKELTETCMDALARFTFSSCTTLPKRSPVTEFLLKGGQSQTWLLGNRLITITTSGGGHKLGRIGLCDKCAALCSGSTESHSDDVFSQSDNHSHTPASEGRRRHKSAAVNKSYPLEPLKPSSFDDMELHRQSSTEDVVSPRDVRNESRLGRGGRMLSVTEEVDNLLTGLKVTPNDPLNPHLCNCWCQSWAEVFIRRSTGNMAWIMRIENDQLLVAQGHSFPLADISTLFMPTPEKPFDVDSLGKIDSESLEEKEYESLYAQHFPAETKPLGNTTGQDEHVLRPVALFTMDTQDLHVDPNDLPTITIERAKEDQKDHQAEQSEGDSTTGAPPVVLASSGGTSPVRTSSGVGGTSPGGTSSLKRSNSSPELASSVERSDLDADLQHKALRKSFEIKQASQSDLHNTEIEDTGGPSITKSETNVATSSQHTVSESALPVERLTKPILQTQMSVDSATSNTTPDDFNYPDMNLMQRKPRGHTISVMSPTNERRTSHYDHGSFRENMRSGVNPSFVFLQLYHSPFFACKEETPLLLPQNQAIDRAVKVLDHITPYETHKIGVLYVGPDQAGKETSILSNVYGSSRYAEFLQGLGKLLRLKDCNPEHTFLGGLDSSGNDGSYAYSWEGDGMQVIYHVATLMPNKSNDPNCNAKKLHIGNDYVSIVYNESGEEYKRGTIKGQFNYVNVVIQPLDYGSNAVTIKAKEDIAPIIGHMDTKIIGDCHLSVLVRQLALHANLASVIFQRQMTNPQDPYASNWLERLRQIKRIRTKILQLETGPEKRRTDSMQEDFTQFV